MRLLHIHYVLDGKRRGYQFIESTRDLDPAHLKTLWQNAFPRGQGWGDPALVGAMALKSFTLDDNLIAACETTITDQRDEAGRMGIRTAVIRLMNATEHAAYLQTRIAQLPPDTVAAAERGLYSHDWELLFRKVRDFDQPRTLWKPQTILTCMYTAGNWHFVEACILLLVTRATLLTNLIELTPKINPFADRAIPFTTLALDHREESRITAIPSNKLGDVAAIDVCPHPLIP